SWAASSAACRSCRIERVIPNTRRWKRSTNAAAASGSPELSPASRASSGSVHITGPFVIYGYYRPRALSGLPSPDLAGVPPATDCGGGIAKSQPPVRPVVPIGAVSSSRPQEAGGGSYGYERAVTEGLPVNGKAASACETYLARGVDRLRSGYLSRNDGNGPPTRRAFRGWRPSSQCPCTRRSRSARS